MIASGFAAVVTGVVCYPRLSLWDERPSALWLLEALLVLSSFVLWSFVFGWYPRYFHHHAWRKQIRCSDWIRTVLLGLAGAAALTVWVDPILQKLRPQDYPASLPAWVASALFSVTLSQLFCCYAPLAFFARLTARPAMAVFLTVVLGEVLVALQLSASSITIDLRFAFLLFGMRALLGWASAWIFARGGLLPGTAWSLLLEARLLLD